MTSDERPDSWIRVALRPDILQRSARVGLVVGTMLALINHGDKLLAMELDSSSFLKILLTYVVPFSVSTWASVQTARVG